jgi:transcription elongation factor Elf1
MGIRRRKVVKLPKKKLPKIFQCPSCGEEAINITIVIGNNLAEIKCSKCGIEASIPITSFDEPVDVYCKFTDKLYAGSTVRE